MLFLDEPTIGLDVSMQATVRGFIRAYNERFGATVLLTSHYMEDVAALCPRVMVIDKGRLIYDGALPELIRRVRPDKRMLLRFSRPVERRDLEALGSVIEHRDAEAIVQVSKDALQSAVARALSTFGREARMTIDETNTFEDADTADMFTEISRGIDKWLWFVEAHTQATK